MIPLFSTKQIREVDNYAINKLGIQYLFIDISRNEGGNSNANNVFYQNINYKPNPWKEILVRKVSLESKLLITGFSLYHENNPLKERLVKYQKKVESGDLTGFQRSFISLKNGDLSTHTYSNNINSNRVFNCRW